jgi:hypothetical protein
MAKIDKELLIKHSFWIALGVFLLVWLIEMICLPAVDGGTVSAKQGEYKTAYDAIEKLSKSGNIEGGKVANEKFTAAWDVKKKNLEERKLIVWQDAYNGQNKALTPGQEALFSWPAELANHLDSKPDAKGSRLTVADKAFGAELDGDPNASQPLRDNYRDNLYRDQLEGFTRAILPPIYTSPIGPAYYLDSWQTAVHPVTWDNTTTISNRDAWLAQEDLCVKLEMVRVIRNAIDAVARGKIVEREFLDRNGKPMPLTVLQTDLSTATVTKERDDKGLPGYLTEVPVPAAVAAQIAAAKTDEERKKLEDAVNKAKEKVEQARQSEVAAIDASAAKAVIRVRNTAWELQLILEREPKKGQVVISNESTVKNVHPDGRTLARAGVLFRITPYDATNRVEREALWVLLEGDPLAHYEENIKGPVQKVRPEVMPLSNAKFSDYLMLEQLFTWYNAPIKRVDKIEVGTERARSHRTAIRPLQPALQFPTQTDTTAATTSSGPPGGGSSLGPMGGSSLGPMGGSSLGPMGLGGGLGGGADKSTTPQGPIAPNRYVDVSEQCRRLPVGLVLVVDQAYVPDVLTALANSRLQMWTTQIHWKHVGGVTAPDAGSAGSGGAPHSGMGEGGPMGGGVPPGVGPGIGRPGSGSSLGGPPAGFGSGMGGKGQPGTPGGGGLGGTGSDPSNAGALSQDDPNLIELAIYSIASLYEKPPPVEKTDAGTEQPMGGTPMPPPKAP